MSENVLPTTTGPVCDKPVLIKLRRDLAGDWHVIMFTDRGEAEGNFGPHTDNMLTALCDFLYAQDAGNWEAVERETPR